MNDWLSQIIDAKTVNLVTIQIKALIVSVECDNAVNVQMKTMMTLKRALSSNNISYSQSVTVTISGDRKTK